jgi:ribonuclease HII
VTQSCTSRRRPPWRGLHRTLRAHFRAAALTPSLPPLAAFDAAWATRGFRCMAGVDEVGRGCLAGPVVAAAVVLGAGTLLDGVNDSKQLTPAQRAAAFARIHAAARAVGVGTCSVEEIDRLNILHASLEAMRRAVAALAWPRTGAPVAPDLVLVDGNRCFPDPPCEAVCVVKGDARSQAIAAASIIAKVTRDGLMQRLAHDHPAYGWAANAGYPTAAHREALRTHGPTAHHRRSFRLG